MMGDAPRHHHRGLPGPGVVAPADVQPQLAIGGAVVVQAQPGSGHELRHRIRREEVVGERRKGGAIVLGLPGRIPVRERAQPISTTTSELHQAGRVVEAGPAADRLAPAEQGPASVQETEIRAELQGSEPEALRTPNELVSSLLFSIAGPPCSGR